MKLLPQIQGSRRCPFLQPWRRAPGKLRWKNHALRLTTQRAKFIDTFPHAGCDSLSYTFGLQKTRARVGTFSHEASSPIPPVELRMAGGSAGRALGNCGVDRWHRPK